MKITNITYQGNLVVECTLDGVDVFYYDGKNVVTQLRIFPVPPVFRALDFMVEKFQEGYYDSLGKKRYSGKIHRKDIH